MADIRINALATTAASTASDDFVAVDGSANGTRKLNAYSPTFGGNLTVSGNIGLGSAASSWGGGAKAIQGQNGSLAFYDGATDQLWLSQNAYWDGSWKYIANGFASSLQQYNGELYFYSAGSGSSGGSITLSEKLKLDASGNTTLAGNLTVSGTGGFGNTVSITKAGGAILELNDSNQTARIRTVQTGVTHDLAFHVESAEKMRLFSNGNLFVGASPVDGGQKLQVSGNGIFGNTTGASTTTPVNLSLGGTYGTTYANGIKLSVFDGGGTKHGLGVTSGVLYFATTDTATTIQLATNNTTALTLDSSQSAKFANQVAANNGSFLVYYNSGSARISPSLIADVSSTATSTSGLPPALLIRNRGTSTQNQWARIAFAAGSNAISATDGIIGADISAQFVGAITGNTRSTDIVFGTADQTVSQEPIERMRIKYNGRINFASLPTSSAGLSTGDIWNDAGTLKIVQP